MLRFWCKTLQFFMDVVQYFDGNVAHSLASFSLSHNNLKKLFVDHQYFIYLNVFASNVECSIYKHLCKANNCTARKFTYCLLLPLLPPATPTHLCRLTYSHRGCSLLPYSSLTLGRLCTPPVALQVSSLSHHTSWTRACREWTAPCVLPCFPYLRTYVLTYLLLLFTN